MAGETEIQTAPQPTASVPYNEGMVNALPGYYTDTAQDFSGFIQDYLANMNAPGGFTSGYTGDMVAGLDPYQTQAYNAGTTATGFQDPYFTSGANTMQTGQNWVSDAHNYSSTVPKQSFNTGNSMIGDQYSQLGGVDPYLQAGVGALNQASTWLNNSAVYDPNEMQRHLSPYISGVADEIARLSNENLFEEVIPNINSTFVGSGQFGSTRNGDFMQQAIRNNQREILGAQSNALNTAYGQAADDYLGWGQLGGQVGNALGNLGQTYGGLGSTFLDKLIGGANMGTSVANVGGQQANYGTSLGELGGLFSDLGTNFGNYGITGADQKWTDISNLYGLGDQMQTYNQNVLDTGYKDWLSRWTQPVDLAGALAKMIPSYTDKVAADKFGFTAGVPEENNNYNDLLAFLAALNGSGA